MQRLDVPIDLLALLLDLLCKTRLGVLKEYSCLMRNVVGRLDNFIMDLTGLLSDSISNNGMIVLYILLEL